MVMWRQAQHDEAVVAVIATVRPKHKQNSFMKPAMGSHGIG
jgi:hypothetical protein